MITVHKEPDTTPAPTSQLRHDLLRDEWVIIANNRKKRPQDFAEDKDVPPYDPAKDVFAHFDNGEQEPDVLIYADNDNEWTTRVIPNKFPTVSLDQEGQDLSEGVYHAMAAYGKHEVVITRDPLRDFAQLEVHELAEVIDAYHERYLAMMNHKGIKSISVFHNHGARAGASIRHPHSQILALPVVVPAVQREIVVCNAYYQKNHHHLWEMMMEQEVREGTRIVYTNKKFIAFCPFASPRAFAIRIAPRKMQPYFERITMDDKMFLADALRQSLYALGVVLNNPDYNYFLRTAPCDGAVYDEYSYYVDILPHTHTYGGFEYSTDIEVVPVAPEDAATALREVCDATRGGGTASAVADEHVASS